MALSPQMTTNVQEYDRTWNSPLADAIRRIGKYGRSHPSASTLVLNRSRPAHEVLEELSPEELGLLSILRAECQVLRDFGAPAPSTLTPKDELELLSLANRQVRCGVDLLLV